jgi:hypothetical protein
MTLDGGQAARGTGRADATTAAIAARGWAPSTDRLVLFGDGLCDRHHAAGPRHPAPGDVGGADRGRSAPPARRTRPDLLQLRHQLRLRGLLLDRPPSLLPTHRAQRSGTAAAAQLAAADGGSVHPVPDRGDRRLRQQDGEHLLRAGPGRGRTGQRGMWLYASLGGWLLARPLDQRRLVASVLRSFLAPACFAATAVVAVWAPSVARGLWYAIAARR